MNRFSANLGFLWAEHALPDRIRKAVAQGFRAVELHWPYDEDPAAINALCQHLGVTLLALNTPLGDDAGAFGLAALPGKEADFRESFRRAADFATRAGAGTLHVMAGIVENTAESRDALAQNLLWAEAEATDFKLLLEPLNAADKPGYMYNLPEQAVTVIEKAGLRNTRLMFDAYHIGREGRDPIKEYTRFANHIGHIQIAGVPHRHEPFTGSVDYAAFLKHITEAGHSGWVGCEYIPENNAEAGMEELRELSAFVPV